MGSKRRIYNLAEKWQKNPAEVYKILNETHILDDYIFVCYDTTIGAVANDDVLNSRHVFQGYMKETESSG